MRRAVEDQDRNLAKHWGQRCASPVRLRAFLGLETWCLIAGGRAGGQVEVAVVVVVVVSGKKGQEHCGRSGAGWDGGDEGAVGGGRWRRSGGEVYVR